MTPTHRRPSGVAPPLPREIGHSTWLWAASLGGVVVFWLLFGNIAGFHFWVSERDLDVLDVIVGRRSRGATTAMVQLQRVGLWWIVPIVGWATIAVLVIFRRWRHLIVFVLSLVAVALVTGVVAALILRPRPVEVEILGSWVGFSHPAPPVAALCAALAGAVFCLAPAGRARRWSFMAIAAVTVVFAAAQLYLAVDHPTDVLIGALVGVAVPVIAFRWFVPEEVFAVSYRRGRSAHLDVSGARGDAIRHAVHDQLGLSATDVSPFNQEGSAGSTPLKLTIEGGPDVFAKLLARNHLRADRWYKLGRTLRYGHLEDEARFHSVSRLVEREDYMLRLFQAAGVPSAAPYGIVEITPGREYLNVTEFLDGASEIGDVDVDEAIVDDALGAIRMMWDAGLAHRDIKPANVMVRDGRVHLIDVAFAESRPSPWREAVDLSNMMLVLALQVGPEAVLERARLQFSEDEIGEAFAASRGVTLPSELRRHIQTQGRDLLAEFRALVPPRAPVKIQVWSYRRVALTVWVAVVAAAGIALVAANLDSAGLL